MTDKRPQQPAKTPDVQPQNIRLFGFTLIELMIVVAVLAIIAAIAFPAYTSQVQKARRAEATSAVLGAAQQLERCYTRASTYTGCLNTTDISSGLSHYNISIDPTSPTSTYTLIAEPKGSQSNDVCTFTLTHTGVRGVGEGASIDECWRR